jgi:glycine/serine hydroxymethyltransferase
MNQGVMHVFKISNTVINESRNTATCKPIYTAVLKRQEVIFQESQNLASGNHWAVESEIFWKTRGDHLQITEPAIACAFKKFAEATARWYDAGERVVRNAQHANPSTSSG